MKKNIGLLMAICSAFLYAFNVIIEKSYVEEISSEMILFLMYFGSGIGLFLIHLWSRKTKKASTNRIPKKEIPKIIGIVICELLASFFIIEAVKNVNAGLVSLLSVFEIIMTAICAFLIFKTPIGKNEIMSILLMVIGFIILNFKDGAFNEINMSSLLVIGACLCWGIENNITASISSKEPAFFTAIKCSCVSLLYLFLVLWNGTFCLDAPILILYGFFTYGLSILTYAISTKYLGANKATIIFSFSPIFGVLLAILIYHEKITIPFIISSILMICAIFLLNKNTDKKSLKKEIIK